MVRSQIKWNVKSRGLPRFLGGKAGRNATLSYLSATATSNCFSVVPNAVVYVLAQQTVEDRLTPNLYFLKLCNCRAILPLILSNVDKIRSVVRFDLIQNVHLYRVDRHLIIEQCLKEPAKIDSSVHN